MILDMGAGAPQFWKWAQLQTLGPLSLISAITLPHFSLTWQERKLPRELSSSHLTLRLWPQMTHIMGQPYMGRWTIAVIWECGLPSQFHLGKRNFSGEQCSLLITLSGGTGSKAQEKRDVGDTAVWDTLSLVNARRLWLYCTLHNGHWTIEEMSLTHARPYTLPCRPDWKFYLFCLLGRSTPCYLEVKQQGAKGAAGIGFCTSVVSGVVVERRTWHQVGQHAWDVLGFPLIIIFV